MSQYNRPFMEMMWKEKAKLSGIYIPDTLVIRNNPDYFLGMSLPKYEIDWYFTSKKTGQIMKRHEHNVNLQSLQAHFIRRNQDKSVKKPPDLLIRRNDYADLEDTLVCTVKKQLEYEGPPPVGLSILNANFNSLLTSPEFVELTHKIRDGPFQRREETYILQEYEKPFIDCIYEVSVDTVYDQIEKNQLVFQNRKSGPYTFTYSTRRYSDQHVLTDLRHHTRYQQFLEEEVCTSDSRTNPGKKNDFDTLINETLNKGMRDLLRNQCLKILNYTHREYWQLKSAQFEWIIRAKGLDDYTPTAPGQVVLLNIKNISLNQDAAIPKTLHQMDLSNMAMNGCSEDLAGRHLRNKKNRPKSQYQNLGKHMDLSHSVLQQSTAVSSNKRSNNRSTVYQRSRSRGGQMVKSQQQNPLDKTWVDVLDTTYQTREYQNSSSLSKQVDILRQLQSQKYKEPEKEQLKVKKKQKSRSPSRLKDYNFMTDPKEFDSEQFLLKTEKLKEEQDLKVLIAKNQGEQKLELMREQVLKAEQDVIDLDAALEAEENMIANLKNSSKAMAEEIKSYEKLKDDDREFFQLNIERIKQHGEPPVDQLLFIDPESAKEVQKLGKYSMLLGIRHGHGYKKNETHNKINRDIYDELNGPPTRQFKFQRPPRYFNNDMGEISQEHDVSKPINTRRASPHSQVQALSNSQAYFKSISGMNNEMNKLEQANKQIKTILKDLKSYEKRCKKIISLENYYREECLEYLYSIAYPNIQHSQMKTGGAFQIPSIQRDRALHLEKRNAKIEQGLIKLYAAPMKKVSEMEPKKLDQFLRKN